MKSVQTVKRYGLIRCVTAPNLISSNAKATWLFKFKSAPATGATTTAAAAPATESVARQTHPEQPSPARIAASTAAGVTVGSIVGHAIGNALSSVFGLAPTKSNGVPVQEDTFENCTVEFQEFYNCALKNEKLDNCKTFHDMWMKCQSKKSDEDDG